MAGKGSGRRPGANDALYLKNNPFPSLLERRKEKEQDSSQQQDRPATLELPARTRRGIT